MTTLYLHRITDITITQPGTVEPDAYGPGYRPQIFLFTDDDGHVTEITAFLHDPDVQAAPTTKPA